jgi:hypothetical protein
MNAARFEKDGFGSYQVVDTRNGRIVKRNIKKISKAAAYVDYYNEEIEKAEKQWK